MGWGGVSLGWGQEVLFKAKRRRALDWKGGSEGVGRQEVQGPERLGFEVSKFCPLSKFCP